MQDFIYIAVVVGFFATCLAAVSLFGKEEARESAPKDKE